MMDSCQFCVILVSAVTCIVTGDNAGTVSTGNHSAVSDAPFSPANPEEPIDFQRSLREPAITSKQEDVPPEGDVNLNSEPTLTLTAINRTKDNTNTSTTAQHNSTGKKKLTTTNKDINPSAVAGKSEEIAEDMREETSAATVTRSAGSETAGRAGFVRQQLSNEITLPANPNSAENREDKAAENNGILLLSTTKETSLDAEESQLPFLGITMSSAKDWRVFSKNNGSSNTRPELSESIDQDNSKSIEVNNSAKYVGKYPSFNEHLDSSNGTTGILSNNGSEGDVSQRSKILQSNSLSNGSKSLWDSLQNSSDNESLEPLNGTLLKGNQQQQQYGHLEDSSNHKHQSLSQTQKEQTSGNISQSGGYHHPVIGSKQVSPNSTNKQKNDTEQKHGEDLTQNQSNNTAKSSAGLKPPVLPGSANQTGRVNKSAARNNSSHDQVGGISSSRIHLHDEPFNISLVPNQSGNETNPPKTVLISGDSNSSIRTGKPSGDAKLTRETGDVEKDIGQNFSLNVTEGENEEIRLNNSFIGNRTNKIAAGNYSNNGIVHRSDSTSGNFNNFTTAANFNQGSETNNPNTGNTTNSGIPLQTVTPGRFTKHSHNFNSTETFLYYTYKDKLLESNQQKHSNDTSKVTTIIDTFSTPKGSLLLSALLSTSAPLAEDKQNLADRKWHASSEEDYGADSYEDYDATEDGDDEYIITGRKYTEEHGYVYYEEQRENGESNVTSSAQVPGEHSSDEQWLRHMENIEEHLLSSDTELDGQPTGMREWSHDPFQRSLKHSFLKDNSLSLMVIYTWLAVVAFILIISYVAFKHRQSISNFITDKKLNYRRRRSHRTEEVHQLLSANPYA